MSGTLARQQAIKVGLHGLARALGVAPAGTRTADLTEVNAPGAAAGEAAGEPQAGADRIGQMPVLSPGGDERALGRSPPAASAGTGQARGKGGGGVGALAASVVEQSRAQPEAYARAAAARTTYDSARADFKANVLAINAEAAKTPQQKQALIAAAARTHELERKGSELEAAQGEADAASEALRESQGTLATTLQAAVPGQWSDRLQEALWDASTPSAIYQRNRDAITNNRLSADAVERAGKKYAGYVARNSSTALGKHFALSEVAAQTKRDAQGRSSANDALNQRQGALTERADATTNGPAKVGGKRVLPLTTQERRELAKLRRDQPKRAAEDARLAKVAAKAEARRHTQVMTQGAKMAASIRKLADRREAATASLRRKLARETDAAKFVALLRQLIAERAEIEAARQEARAIERELATGEPPEEGSVDTPKPPFVPEEEEEEVVPPGCPPDYKERCCPICDAGTTCECLGSSPRGGGGAAGGAGGDSAPAGGAGHDLGQQGAASGQDSDPKAHMRIPADVNDFIHTADVQEEGDPGDQEWSPTDDEVLEMAKAWNIPPLEYVALVRGIWEEATAVWEWAAHSSNPPLVNLTGLGYSMDKFWADGGNLKDPIRLQAVKLFQAYFEDLLTPRGSLRLRRDAPDPILELRKRIQQGLTFHQYMTRLPPEMHAMQTEGFDRARVRLSRSFLEREFPAAMRHRELFDLGKLGPEAAAWVARYAHGLDRRAYVAALKGEPHDRALLAGLPAKYKRDIANRKRAEEEASTPKWWETLGYLGTSLLRGASLGKLDPVDLRDDFGVGGPTPAEFRAHVMSHPGLAAVDILGQLSGAVATSRLASSALAKLGVGPLASSAVIGGIASGVQSDALRKLRNGDFEGFLKQVGVGALAAAVGFKVGQYGAMFGSTESAYLRGILFGALGDVAADALVDPSSPMTLERVLLAAAIGGVSGAAGSRRSHLGGRSRTLAKNVDVRPGDAADTSALLDVLARRPRDVRPFRSRTVAAFEGGEIGVAPRAVKELGRTEVEIIEGLSSVRAKAEFIRPGSQTDVSKLAERISAGDAEVAASAFQHLQETGGRFITGDQQQARALHRILGFPKGRIVSVRNWDPQNLVVLLSLARLAAAGGHPRAPVTPDHQ